MILFILSVVAKTLANYRPECDGINTIYCCVRVIWPGFPASVTQGLSPLNYVSYEVFNPSGTTILLFRCRYTNLIDPSQQSPYYRAQMAAINVGQQFLNCDENFYVWVSPEHSWGECTPIDSSSSDSSDEEDGIKYHSDDQIIAREELDGSRKRRTVYAEDRRLIQCIDPSPLDFIS